MEHGNGSLAELAGKLSTRQAAAVTAAIVREIQGIYDVSKLVATDAKLANFLFSADSDGALLVMACDYGGYAPEGTAAEHATCRHPLIEHDESIDVNVANALFSCGVSFMALVAVAPRDLVGPGRALWGPDDHSRLRRAMGAWSDETRADVARAVDDMIRSVRRSLEALPSHAGRRRCDRVVPERARRFERARPSVGPWGRAPLPSASALRRVPFGERQPGPRCRPATRTRPERGGGRPAEFGRAL